MIAQRSQRLLALDTQARYTVSARLKTSDVGVESSESFIPTFADGNIVSFCSWKLESADLGLADRLLALPGAGVGAIIGWIPSP